MDNKETKQITLRIDNKLYEKIMILCDKENRKISPQIEYMLKKYFEIREI